MWFGWQVKQCDPLVTHGAYLSTLEIGIIKCYINSSSLLHCYRNPDANPNLTLQMEARSRGVVQKPKRAILHILLGYRHITVTIVTIITIYAMTNYYACSSFHGTSILTSP